MSKFSFIFVYLPKIYSFEVMIKLIDGRHFIDYLDLEALLEREGWKLRIGMKENWTANDHLEYIRQLVLSKADLMVQFEVDSCSFDTVMKIDVYIISQNQQAESSSLPKHIQFINLQTVC